MNIPFTQDYMASETFSCNTVWEAHEINRTTPEKRDGYSSQAENTTTRNLKTVDLYCEGNTAADDYDRKESAMSQADINDIGKALDINTCNREKYGFFRIAQIMMAIRFSKFANEVAIVGAYVLAKQSDTVGSVARKVIWSMLLLFGAGFMAFQIYQRISYYLSMPTMVNYQVSQNSSLRFPTVTVCSETGISRKAAETLGHDIAETAAQAMPPFPDVDFHPDYRKFNSSLWNVDWEPFYMSMAPQIDEILIECQFKNAPCKSDEALQMTKTDLGVCFSFNPSEANYITTQPGANYGLRFVLWFNQSDTLVTTSPAAGFRMLLHDPNELPTIKSFGFRISPGTSTSVSFSFKRISQLPPPYGSCRDDHNYTFMRCMTFCEGQFIMDRCNCRPANLQFPGPVCTPDQVGDCAWKLMGKDFISTGESRKCDCPLQCIQNTYPFSISASPLSQLFLNSILKKPNFKGRKLPVSKLKKELVYLEVFYSHLIYTDIQTLPAYSILDLFCEIGGTLGLILGGSVLSVVQILQLAVQVFGDLKVAYRCSGTTSIA